MCNEVGKMVNTVEKLRFKRTMSQWDSSLLSDISQSMISLIETAYRVPTHEDTKKLAKGLGMSV